MYGRDPSIAAFFFQMTEAQKARAKRIKDKALARLWGSRLAAEAARDNSDEEEEDQ